MCCAGSLSVLVSFHSTEGSTRGQPHNMSSCHHEAFDRTMKSPQPQACWPVVTAIQVQKLGLKSTDKVPWARHHWWYTAVTDPQPQQKPWPNVHLRIPIWLHLNTMMLKIKVQLFPLQSCIFYRKYVTYNWYTWQFSEALNRCRPLAMNWYKQKKTLSKGVWQLISLKPQHGQQVAPGARGFEITVIMGVEHEGNQLLAFPKSIHGLNP